MSAVDIDLVSVVFEAMLTKTGLPIHLSEQPGEAGRQVTAEIAAHPEGLLPVFLIASEAHWQRRFGSGFGLEIRHADLALLEHKVVAIHDAELPCVLLALRRTLDDIVFEGRLATERLGQAEARTVP